MAISLTANLLEYYEQNAPLSSQTAPFNPTSPTSNVSANTFSPTPLGADTIGAQGAIGTFNPSSLGADTIGTQGGQTPFQPSAIDESSIGDLGGFLTFSPITLGESSIGTQGALGISDYFANDYATGFQTNFTQGTPSNIVGLDAVGQIFSQPLLTSLMNVNYITNTFAIGYTPSMTSTQIQGISGEPGGMTYTAPQNPPTPHSSIVEGKFFTPDGPLETLKDGVAVPPNHLSAQSNLPAGNTEDPHYWKTSNSATPFPSPKVTPLTDTSIKKVPSEVDFFSYFEGTPVLGFTSGMQHLGPTQIQGISGDPGTMIYKAKTPFGISSQAWSQYNAGSKYIDQDTRYSADDFDFDTVIKTKRKVSVDTYGANNPESVFTLRGLYEQYNSANMQLKYPGYVKQYKFQGIQKETPILTRYGDNDSVIKDVAAEHAERLELARDAGPFMRNRTFMGLLSLQSRFQISLGMIPHALRSPRGIGKRNLPINAGQGILDTASAYAYILGGSIQRVPYSLTDYSMQHSIAAKYGIGNTTDVGLWDMLRKIKLLGKAGPQDDLVPFYFTKPGSQEILQFRGTIKTLSHSSTPQWQSKKYFGRPDSVHTYTGFDQNLSFSFELYADGKGNMFDMYTGLNRLHGLLKPSWKNNMMEAPIVLLTIGDFVIDHPGFLKSLSIQPNEQVYWDLGLHPIRGLPQVLQVLPAGLTDKIGAIGLNKKETAKLPRAFSISVNYQMLEKEMPNSNGKGFWGNQEYKPWSEAGGKVEGSRWINLENYKQSYGKYLLYKGGL